jgi:hypothetical protein
MDEFDYKALLIAGKLAASRGRQKWIVSPPESILSYFNNRNFGGTQSLLLRTCTLTCLLTAWRTAFLRPHRQNHWHHRWAYPMLTAMAGATEQPQWQQWRMDVDAAMAMKTTTIN